MGKGGRLLKTRAFFGPSDLFLSIEMTSPWRPIGQKYHLSHGGLDETLVGGQSFAWTSLPDNIWTGVITRSVVELRWKEGQLCWRHAGGEAITEESILDYLWLDDSYTRAVDELPWRTDSVLKNAIHGFPGLRILRQPLDEVLLVFLLSSAKSIPQIRQLCRKIHKLLGEDLGGENYAFPGWPSLSALSESDARALGMGYRAKYLVGTAGFLQERPGFLENIREKPYEEAHKLLMELPGVGPKVADCVLLFGGEKTEAFPIDTWILQSLQKQYGMRGWTVGQMREFARIHFGSHAGLAQQFLFSQQRNLGKREPVIAKKSNNGLSNPR